MIPLAHRAYENDSIEDQYIQHCITTLYPYMSPYYCSIPASWSFLYKSLNEFYNTPEIIFRDGIISLLSFFKRFPSPINKKQYIYINKQFKNFIPNSWHKNIGYYQLKINNALKKNIIVPCIGNIEYLTFMMKELSDVITIDSKIIILRPNNKYFSIGHRVYQTIDFNSRFFIFLEQFHNKFSNIPLQIITNDEIHSLGILENYTVIDFSKYCLEFADSSLTHKLYTLGANSTSKNTVIKIEKILPLSSYHEIILGKKFNASSVGYEDHVVQMLIQDNKLWTNYRNDNNEIFTYNDELYHLGKYCLNNYVI